MSWVRGRGVHYLKSRGCVHCASSEARMVMTVASTTTTTTDGIHITDMLITSIYMYIISRLLIMIQDLLYLILLRFRLILDF